jgi:hypothetical protein
MRDLYVLDDDKRPVAVSDLMEWVEWRAAHDHERTLAYDQIGDVRVSTVFLGIAGVEMVFHPDGEPLLWETMIFNGTEALYQTRYTSHDEAIAGHAVAVALVHKGAANDT